MRLPSPDPAGSGGKAAGAGPGGGGGGGGSGGGGGAGSVCPGTGSGGSTGDAEEATGSGEGGAEGDGDGSTTGGPVSPSTARARSISHPSRAPWAATRRPPATMHATSEIATKRDRDRRRFGMMYITLNYRSRPGPRSRKILRTPPKALCQRRQHCAHTLLGGGL